jgi:hypothetical protein
MAAYSAQTADGQVATGTGAGNTITVIAGDASVFGGASVSFTLTEGAVSHSMLGNPTGHGCITSVGHTAVTVPVGVTWSVDVSGATAATSILLIIA